MEQNDKSNDTKSPKANLKNTPNVNKRSKSKSNVKEKSLDLDHKSSSNNTPKLNQYPLRDKKTKT